MQFWESEVFKTSEFNNNFFIGFFTGHFSDHPLEDIIEKIASQFITHRIHGRPPLSGTQAGHSMSVTPDTTIEIAALSGSRTGIHVSLKK